MHIQHIAHLDTIGNYTHSPTRANVLATIGFVKQAEHQKGGNSDTAIAVINMLPQILKK